MAGKSIPVPEGYQGIFQHVYSRHVSNINSGHVLKVTEEELSPREQPIPLNNQEDDGEEENINIFKGLTTFDEITIWEHDATPDESTDGVIRAIEEWIEFANKVGSLIVLSAQVGEEMLILRVKDSWVFNGRRSEEESVISYSVVMRSLMMFSGNKISYLLLSIL